MSQATLRFICRFDFFEVIMKKGLNFIHGIIAVVLGILLLEFGGYVLMPIFGEKGAFLGGVFIALIALAFTFLTKTKIKEVFPTELPPIKKFFGSVMMYVGVTFMSSGLSVIIGRFFDANVRSDAIDSLILKMHPVLAIFLVAVIPAVCEEFFCRGFLVKCFSGIKKEWLLITIVGVIFGAMHLDAYTFVPTALTGALLCFIAIRTKSLILPMILHFGNNALSVALTYSSASESASNAIELTDFSIPQSIGMSLLYIGFGLLPLVVGYRMFVGKRVFVFKTFVALMVTVGVCVTGFVTFTLFSFRLVSFENEREEITEQAEEIPLKINGMGNFELFLEINSSKPVEVTVICDGSTIYKATVNGSVSVQRSFEYQSGRGGVIIITPIDGEKSTVNISYVILESVLPQ